jgi:hypothetical protein
MASTASGGIGLLAIAYVAARRLAPGELGFFFSFLSFGALIQLGDFGLSYAVLQTAGSLAGTGRLDEIPSLARRARVWNLTVSLLMTIVVAAIATATFSAKTLRPTSATITYVGPFAAYLAAVFVNQLTMPALALREGCGKITQVWTLRLVQEWVASIGCLIALAAGGGLWSLAVLAGARATVAAVWVQVGDRIPRATGDRFPQARWWSDVWPFQWKIALSSLSGYFIFRAFAPIVLLEQGAVAAGRFGLAISLMNLLIAVSSAWPLSQAARYAAMNAAGRFDELRHDFPRMVAASTLLACFAAAAGVAAITQAARLGVAVAMKLPDPTTTALVIAAAVFHHVVSCFAVFLRAEGREPLLIASVAGSIVTVLAIWAAAHLGTLREIAIVNLACAFTGIPVVLLLFRPRWRRMKLAAARRV